MASCEEGEMISFARLQIELTALLTFRRCGTVQFILGIQGSSGRGGL